MAALKCLHRSKCSWPEGAADRPFVVPPALQAALYFGYVRTRISLSEVATAGLLRMADQGTQDNEQDY